jgi:hypothetical protein
VNARTVLSGAVILVLLVAGLLMLEAGSAVVASTAQTPMAMLTPTNPPLPDTPTGVPPYPSATPVDSAFAPIVFEQARPATATISPDASPTMWLTPTGIPPYPSATPVDSAFAPIVFEQMRTATATFTPTATISPDATPTIWLTPTAMTP